MVKSNYDCIVLGGGPAGSTAAALVAEAGHSTLLVEREKFPRFHIGESLMPETYWVLQRLGVLDKMKNSHFTKKYSVQFVNGRGKASQPFFFQEHDPRECSQTWQVERAEFDNMLFENAAAKGADCIDQTRALDIMFDGSRAIGVKLKLADGTTQEILSQVVMDATGQQSLIANKLGLKQINPELRKAAVWSYFANAERVAGEHGGATVILQTQSQQAWFWYIPLSNDITSVGLVGDIDFVLKSRATPGDAFCEELGNCPALTKRLEHAKMQGDFHVAREFSYSTTQHAGPGWVLIGDAFGFIDPIYSSGVYFAMKTGEMAADSVIEAFRSHDLSGEVLGRWTEEFKSGAERVRHLVHAFYDTKFSFGEFMSRFPQHRDHLTDLLIGRVFDEGAEAIIRDLVPAIESSRNS